MLAYFLATIMALISLGLFLNSFISPKTHRQDDFLWSGLGLFYALILWSCAGRFTGAVLLGQVAGVAITLAFMWENRQLRKLVTAESDSNESLEGFSILSLVAQSIGKISSAKKTPEKKSPESVTSAETPEVVESPISSSEETKESEVSQVASETVSEVQEEEKSISTEVEETEEKVAEKLDDELNRNSEAEEVSETEEEETEEELLGSSLTEELETKPSKPNIFSRLFGVFRKSTPEKQPNSQEDFDKLNIEQALSEIEEIDDEDEFVSPELDLKTTATEVEDAIENLELSENLEAQSEAENIVNNSSEAITSPEEKKESETIEMDSELVDTKPVEDNLEKTIEEEREEEISTTLESKPSQEVVEETEVSQSDTETVTTPDEDDIIESLSDLFPTPNEVESESQSSGEKSDEDQDAEDQTNSRAKMLEDDEKSESDSNSHQ